MTENYLTRSQIEDAVRLSTESGRRDIALMIVVGYLHGMRVSEIAALRWDDVDLERHTLYVRRVKGSVATMHALSRRVFNEEGRLQAAFKEKNSGETVFSLGGNPLCVRTIRRYISSALFHAGVPPALAHPHSLKHALATHMLRRGLPVPVVQKALGHRSIVSTASYLHVTQQESDSGRVAVLGAKDPASGSLVSARVAWNS